MGLEKTKNRPKDGFLVIDFGPYRIRTGRLFHAMEALYQMS